MRSHRLAIASVLLLVLGAAGCSSSAGSDSSAEAGSTTAASSSAADESTTTTEAVPEAEAYTGDDFYATPDPIPTAPHGTLVRYQPMDDYELDGATTYRIM